MADLTEFVEELDMCSSHKIFNNQNQIPLCHKYRIAKSIEEINMNRGPISADLRHVPILNSLIQTQYDTMHMSIIFQFQHQTTIKMKLPDARDMHNIALAIYPWKPPAITSCTSTFISKYIGWNKSTVPIHILRLSSLDIMQRLFYRLVLVHASATLFQTGLKAGQQFCMWHDWKLAVKGCVVSPIRRH